jgi:hypothetical protein
MSLAAWARAVAFKRPPPPPPLPARGSQVRGGLPHVQEPTLRCRQAAPASGCPSPRLDHQRVSADRGRQAQKGGGAPAWHTPACFAAGSRCPPHALPSPDRQLQLPVGRHATEHAPASPPLTQHSCPPSRACPRPAAPPPPPPSAPLQQRAGGCNGAHARRAHALRPASAPCGAAAAAGGASPAGGRVEQSGHLETGAG